MMKNLTQFYLQRFEMKTILVLLTWMMVLVWPIYEGHIAVITKTHSYLSSLFDVILNFVFGFVVTLALEVITVGVLTGIVYLSYATILWARSKS